MTRGLVLAGGKSSRFGSDKALAVYEGESFLSRAARILAGLKLDLVITVREGASYSVPDGTLLEDCYPEKGPLGGIYTAMREFPGDDFLVLTCDMPAVDEKTLLPLIEEYTQRPVLTLYQSLSGQAEPFPGIYPGFLLPVIFRNIFSEKLAMHELIGALVEKNMVSFQGLPQKLLNVNHHSDLQGLHL